jgi:bone morphogenetic protein receptor type-2
MQSAVCRKKARVVFNRDWRHESSAGRLIRETVEDCTDQDGEARLTALCVHERIAHLLRGNLTIPCISFITTNLFLL